MNVLKQVQKQLIEENGTLRRPNIPLSQLSVKDKQAYLREKFDLTHGKGKRKRKSK